MNKLRANKHRLGLSALCCAVLLFALFVSLSLLVLESHHEDCTGANCPICALLQMAEDTLTAMGFGADFGVPTPISVPVIAQISLLPITPPPQHNTLVLLKIQQNK